MYGKLPKGTLVDGVLIQEKEINGFFDHGPDVQLARSQASTPSYPLINGIYNGQGSESIRPFTRSQFVHVKRGSQPGHSVVYVEFFQENNWERNTRGRSWSYWCIEFPDNDMDSFINEITHDPLLLEAVYMKAFPNMDALTPESPGFLRIRPDGFYIIDEDSNLANCVVLIKNNPLLRDIAVSEYLNNIPFYTYQ